MLMMADYFLNFEQSCLNVHPIKLHKKLLHFKPDLNDEIYWVFWFLHLKLFLNSQKSINSFKFKSKEFALSRYQYKKE